MDPGFLWIIKAMVLILGKIKKKSSTLIKNMQVENSLGKFNRHDGR